MASKCSWKECMYHNVPQWVGLFLQNNHDNVYILLFNFSQPAREAYCDKNGVMAYLCYKQTNFRHVFSNYYPRTIPGWLTLFYLSPFGRKTQFKKAATCPNHYAKNGISSLITMQIVNAIDGFELSKTISNQQLFWLCIILYRLRIFLMSIRNIYMDNIHNWMCILNLFIIF